MTHTDGWSWFDAPELSDVDLSAHSVTAVLVCRNAGAWLNATLAGLGRLDRRPDTIVAVDNESTDDTAELLDAAYDAGLVDQIVRGKASFSFGQAVEWAMGLKGTPTTWIWLLHDDAVPEPDALTELLTLAARTPRLAIAVPLLVRPSRRNHAARTLEIGASISGAGRRTLGLEPDEVAQGQYDSMSVLGGSTCGMLVKWDSLLAVGGFDTCIPCYRDGVDIGWRAQLIDQWVMTCPTARFVHRQAGRSEIRQGTIAERAGRSEAEFDRLMGLRLVAAHARGLSRFTILIRMTLVCLLSALGYVLGRAPDHAKDEVQAWTDFLFGSRKPVAQLRKKIMRISKGSSTTYRVRSLRPTLGGVVEDGFQAFARWFHDQLAPSTDAEMTLDDLLGDEFTRRLGEGRRRIPAGVWTVLVIAGVAFMARNLYTSGLVTASGLLGAPATLAQAFQTALSHPGDSEPWMLVSAAFSAVCARPGWFPVVMLIVAFPLTMLVAVWYSRSRVEHGALRWFGAAGYASLPILMGGLNRGALWLVVIALMLPFVAEWISRLDLDWAGARSLQSLAGIALSGVLILAILPVLWVPVCVAAIIVAVRAQGTARIVRVVVALLVPVGFWAQAVPSYVRNPARALLTPEPMLTPAPLSWQMLFARPMDSGLPPLWVSLTLFSVLWLGALVVMAQVSWHRWVALAGAASIAVGILLSRASVPVAVTSTHPDPSPWLLIGFAGLLFCVLSWMDQTFGSLEGRDFGGKQALVGFLSLLLIGAFLIGCGWSAWAGMSQVTRGSGTVIPEYLAQNEIQLDTGTLIIDSSSRGWNLRYSGQTFWGQGSYVDGPASNTAAEEILERVVARALAGRSDDTVSKELSAFGVSTVLVLNPSTDTMTALDATSGFQRTTAGGGVEIWSIVDDSQSPTRRSLTTPGAPPIYLEAADEVPSGSPNTLTLAIPPDPSMHVYVGGTELAPAVSGDWRSAFTLAGATGPVEITWSTDTTWTGWVQLAAVVIFLIFVFPPLTDNNAAPETPKYQMRRGR